MSIRIYLMNESGKRLRCLEDGEPIPRVGELVCLKDNKVVKVVEVMHDYQVNAIWIKVIPDE